MILEEKAAVSKTAPAPRGQNQPHKLNLVNRETMTVTGVRDVLSFDVSEVLLETYDRLLKSSLSPCMELR